MDASLTEIVGAVVAIGGLTGGTIKYLVDRVSARQTTLEARQEQERTRFEAERIKHELKVETERLRWEAVMADQMAEMRREIAAQERQISTQDRQLEVQYQQVGYLRRILSAYLDHIAALEGLMKAAGIQIPSLVLPEYPSDDDHERRRHGRSEIGAC